MLRSVAFVVAAVLWPASALAQAPLDASDPAITTKPQVNVEKSALPNYPPEARRGNQQGEVKLRTCLDVSGKPYAGELVQSSGHKLLDDASLDWVNGGALFKPAEASGNPVAVCNYVFTYVWSLDTVRAPSRVDRSSYAEAADMRPADLPVALSRPPRPTYPPGALARRASGTIHYSICIGPDGHMNEVTVLDTDADMELAVAATRWFGGTKYRPGSRDGKPVGVCGLEVEYTWRLPTNPTSKDSSL